MTLKQCACGCSSYYDQGASDPRSIREMVASGFCSCPPVADGLTTFARDCGIAEHRAKAGDPS